MAESRVRRLRRAWAIAFFLIVAVIFGIRLVQVQIVEADELNRVSQDKRAVPITLPAVRGDIVDRNGSVLATTDEKYDVQLSPRNTRVRGGIFYRLNEEKNDYEKVTLDEAYREIAAITGQQPQEIAQIVDDALREDPSSDFAYVKRWISLDQFRELKKLQIPWLTFASNFTRLYPNGAVGGNIIGFFGTEGKPQAGIEYSQNPCLIGEDGSEEYERSADGVPLPGSTVVTKQPRNGGTIRLSLDRDMQWQAQQIVNKTKEESNAEWVLQVVMNAKTGELVAVAEDGSVDPNNVQASESSRRDARAFISPYEPGSSMKAITASALIDQGAATPETHAYVPYSFEISSQGVYFKDAFYHAPQNLTLAGIIVQSSNVGTATLGQRLSPEVRYEYLRKFGIGESTDAGMPIEDAGLLYKPEDWDPQTNFATMFGQGYSSTIVQTAGVFQTIANKGVRIPASLALSCTDSNGNVTQIEHGDPVEVIKPSTAEQVSRILETTANDSFIKSLTAIPGYRIAGKTATGEQPDGRGGYRPDWVYTFSGFFPVDDPQYVVISTVAFPKRLGGNIVSKTSWRETAEAVIRRFHVPPSKGEYESYPLQ